MATAIAVPPSYELPNGDPQNEPLIEDSLPHYTPRTARVSRPVEEREFEYKFEKKLGVALASLKVVAPAAFSKNIPTFCGAGPVKGSVNLYLKGSDTITFVAISVRGRFLSGRASDDFEIILFDISKTLWSKDTDETATNPLLSNKKLSGTHSWPFFIGIPEKVQFTAGRTSSSVPGTASHNTPQTFNERTLIAGIRYEVFVRIGRGKFKMDYKIFCPFGYIPLTRPPPFPPLKVVAYQERTPLLDPTVDVYGWVPAKKVDIQGTLFNSHLAAIDCQLFISAPLVYTRNSVIPLYVCMRSSDQQALDLFATHKAIIVRLQRRIRYRLPQNNRGKDNWSSAEEVRDLVEAVWWPAPSRAPEQSESTTNIRTHTVCLNGELHLRPDLVPSTTLPVFVVEYHVCLLAFDTPGFKMAKKEKFLLEHPVDIVTLIAQGPRSVRYAPPGYDSERPLTVEVYPLGF